MQTAPQYLGIGAGFFAFQIKVIQAINNILSQGVVSTNAVALEAFAIQVAPVASLHGMSNEGAHAYYGQITKLVPLYHNGHPFNFEHGLFWNRGCLGEEQRELLQKLYSLLKI